MERTITLNSRHTIRRLLTYLALLVILAFSLFPLVWIFLTSIKPKSLTFAIPPAWIFPPTLDNYREVFLYGSFPKYFANSLIVALGATSIALLVGSLAAYAFARFQFRGSSLVQVIILVPQIIPPIAIIIPLFVLFRTVNMIDRTPSLIFTYLSFTIPLSIWMMVGFFRDVPQEIEEAALIDGASRWQVLWKVVLPMVTPGLAATAILCFIYSWNEFLYAVILTGRNAKTVPVAITGFITNRDILWGRIAASGSVVLFPVLIFALSVQRYLARGLSKGAIKG